MAQEYLPAPSNVRLADLMKTQHQPTPELAKEIGCSSTISRFISGAENPDPQAGAKDCKGCSKCPRIFCWENQHPDRKNYDIAELGLSVSYKEPLQGVCQYRGGQP